MKHILKDNVIILINHKTKERIIINFNNDINEMALNTFYSLKNIVDNNIKDKCYIINVDRYDTNNKDVVCKFKIKNPNILISSLNINKYIKNIQDKNIIDIDEQDRLMIIFTASNIEDIYNFIKKTDNFYNLLFNILN